MKRVFAVLLFIAQLSYAQDPEFTHYQNSEAYLNPAMACNDTSVVAFFKYRNQWPQLSGGYRTKFLGYSFYLPKSNSAIYMNLLNDMAGKALTTYRYTLGYTKKIRIGKEFLVQVGGELTYFTKRLDWSKLTFGDQIDPRRGFIYQSGDVPRGGNVSGLDLSGGALFGFRNAYIGVSAFHINEPNASVITGHSPIPVKIGVQTGYEFNIKGVRVTPNFQHTSQGYFERTQFGVNLQYKMVVLGGGYRLEDAYLITGGVQFQRFNFFYSYDMTQGNLKGVTGGSHEVSVSYRAWVREAHEKFVRF